MTNVLAVLPVHLVQLATGLTENILRECPADYSSFISADRKGESATGKEKN
jgi:hypothetical protein